MKYLIILSFFVSNMILAESSTPRGIIKANKELSKVLAKKHIQMVESDIIKYNTIKDNPKAFIESIKDPKDKSLMSTLLKNVNQLPKITKRKKYQYRIRFSSVTVDFNPVSLHKGEFVVNGKLLKVSNSSTKDLMKSVSKIMSPKTSYMDSFLQVVMKEAFASKKFEESLMLAIALYARENFDSMPLLAFWKKDNVQRDNFRELMREIGRLNTSCEDMRVNGEFTALSDSTSNISQLSDALQEVANDNGEDAKEELEEYFGEIIQGEEHEFNCESLARSIHQFARPESVSSGRGGYISDVGMLSQTDMMQTTEERLAQAQAEDRQRVLDYCQGVEELRSCFVRVDEDARTIYNRNRSNYPDRPREQGSPAGQYRLNHEAIGR